jgi:8-oxo-dGTP pyrophosphatase MutT (NUDIX family)
MEQPLTTTVRREIAFQTPWWIIRNDVVVSSSGEGTYTVLEPASGKAGAAMLVVREIDAAIEVLLVRQWRYPLGKFVWELPRGFASADDHDVIATAVRELLEEANVAPARIVPLGEVSPDSGLMALTCPLFGIQVTDGSEAAAGHEIEDVAWLSTGRLVAAIRSGEITDGFTLAALLQAHLRGFITL